MSAKPPQRPASKIASAGREFFAEGFGPEPDSPNVRRRRRRKGAAAPLGVGCSLQTREISESEKGDRRRGAGGLLQGGRSGIVLPSIHDIAHTRALGWT